MSESGPPAADASKAAWATTDQLRDLIWPWQLHLGVWLNAARQGRTSITDASAQVGATEVSLALGRLVRSGTHVVSLLAEPGDPPSVALPPEVVRRSTVDGGLVLILGDEPTAIMRGQGIDVLDLVAIPTPAVPPHEPLSAAERTLLDAVTDATDIISSSGVQTHDAGLAAALQLTHRLLDASALPPSSSGRARLLRDRAATLLVGIEFALLPDRQAPTLSLEQTTRAPLLRCRRAARSVLTAVANENAFE